MRCTDKTQQRYIETRDMTYNRDTTLDGVETRVTRGQDRAETIYDELSGGGSETPHLTGAK